MGIHARTRFKASNIFCRSTERSRTRGNFFIGCSVMGCSSLSIRAEQACRTLPLTFMVQEPQTSSRQAWSQTGGGTRLPAVVTGLRWISIRTEMTFAFLVYGTANSSQCLGASGPSRRSMRTRMGGGMSLGPSPSGVPAGLGFQDGIGQALDRLEGDLRTLGRPAGHGELEPVLVALAPGLHPLRVLARILGLRLRQVELRLVVAAPALVAHPSADQDQLGELQHVPELVQVGGALVERAAGVQHVGVLPAILHAADRRDGLSQLAVVLHT